MATIDISYYVGYCLGCGITFLGRALSATLVAPLSAAEVVLNTQNADPSVVSGATDRLVLSMAGLMAWLRQRRGIVGMCRMVPFDTLLPKPDMNLPGILVLFAPDYPLSTLRTVLACDVQPSARTWAKRLRAFVTHADVYQALLHVRLVDWWAGYLTSICGTFVYRSAYFGSYLSLQQTEFARAGPTRRFLVGQASVLAATLLQYPFQVVSARLQAQAALDPSERLYRGAWDCVAKTWRTAGPVGFYEGVSIRLLSVAGSAAVLFAYGYFRGSGGDGAQVEVEAAGDDLDVDVDVNGVVETVAAADNAAAIAAAAKAETKSVDREWQRQRIQAALAKARGDLKS